MRLIVIISVLLLSSNLFSQKEASNWFFGYKAGVTFTVSPPAFLAGGVIHSSECSNAISDPQGNLLFYTDGDTIWNKLHLVMANGMGLLGSSSAVQGAMIVKQPGSSNNYYVFTLSQVGGVNGFRYSTVDMSLAAGMGSVTVKNQLIYSPSCESMVAVQHCNGRDVWIVTHDHNSNVFRSVLLTGSGLNSTTILSPTGSTYTLGSVGQMKINPAGNKLVITPGVMNTVELFDFDNSTGMVSNQMVLLTSGNPSTYGCEFSPDGSVLYATGKAGSAFYQWDLAAGSTSAIIASQYSVPISYGGALQLAPDGKIYMANSLGTFLGRIDYPNITGAQCQFSVQALSLNGYSCALGLPTIASYYLRTAGVQYNHTVSCQNVTFSTNVTPKLATSTHTPPSYKWIFGDPQSGLSNTSTIANPTHFYSTPGTYTAMFIYQLNCYSDTSRLVVNVINSYPNPLITGTTTICKGEVAKVIATGAYTYSWSNTATNNSIAVTPTVSSVYSVVITNTATACSITKTVGITVNKCTYIEDQNNELTELVFPNPISSYFTLKLKSAASFQMMDVFGNVLIKEVLKTGEHRISINELQPGIYFISIERGNEMHIQKVIVQP